MKSGLNKFLQYIISSSSAILFVSFFMPAVNGCENTPVYPYETLSGPVYLPYIWALALFLTIISRKIKNLKIQTIMEVIYFIISISWIVVWGYSIHKELFKADSHITLDILFPFFAWWLVLILFFKKVFIVRVNYEKFFYRSIWTLGLFAVSFYSIFFIEPHLYGLDISFMSSLILVFTGLLNEFSEKFLMIFSDNKSI